MLINGSHLIGTPVLSVQASGTIGMVSEPIIDPDNLKIVAFRISGGIIPKNGANLLDVSSIREYSQYGMVIDSEEELIEKSDVVKIEKVLDFDFNLIDLKVETKKGSKLGKVIDFTVSNDNFEIQQIIVKRPVLKSFIDPELTIHKREIVEVTDYKIIVKDEEKVIKEKSEHEDFIPNFVNPFRNHEQGYAPVQTKTPGEKDTE